MTASDDARSKFGFGNSLGSRMDIPKAVGARVRLEHFVFSAFQAGECTIELAFKQTGKYLMTENTVEPDEHHYTKITV